MIEHRIECTNTDASKFASSCTLYTKNDSTVFNLSNGAWTAQFDSRTYLLITPAFGAWMIRELQIADKKLFGPPVGSNVINKAISHQ